MHSQLNNSKSHAAIGHRSKHSKPQNSTYAVIERDQEHGQLHNPMSRRVLLCKLRSTRASGWAIATQPRQVTQ